MVELSQFALNLITNLIANFIYDGIQYEGLSFFEQRRINRRIEDAIAEVVEPLLPFLAAEKISEDKQRRLIETCVDELRPLTKNPEPLFQGSLDGQKIFEELYADRELPQVVIEDGLKDIYALLCPRVATLLCKIPAAVKDWEREAWSENYRRLDQLAAQLREIFSNIDKIAMLPAKHADETLSMVRRAQAQKIKFQFDITGLRADRPTIGEFSSFFVHPEIQEISDEKSYKHTVIVTADGGFAEFIQPQHQAVVIGPAGAGKSTWSKWLQREALTPRWVGITVRSELRAFPTNSLPSLHDLMRHAVGQHLAEELTPERIRHWLDARQVLFIFDGFDEIRPDDRDIIFEWIVDLWTAARDCPFIVTSRPLTTDHLERFTEKSWRGWSIEPFDESRIIDYIQRWYAYSPLLPDHKRDINAKELASSWRNDPTIEPLTGNPLLLSTLLMVHHLDGSLPNGRSQLYHRYVEGMLGLWDDRRQVSATSVDLTLDQKRQIVRGFALKLFFDEVEQLDESATLEWLQEFLIKMGVTLSADNVLDALRERSGLIVGPGIYSFAHKTIAEFLVAEAVLQGDQHDVSGARVDRFNLFEHRDDDRWNTVTFLWAGLAPIADVESFIKECISDNRLELAYGLLHDQYTRIPKEIRRQLLILPHKQPFKKFKDNNVYWSTSRPNYINQLSLDFAL
jgi:hypothetical protein